jgi:hypothetical protein
MGKHLLIFRCGGETYGIPVEEVIGIISNTGTNGLAVITNTNGVQIMIIVDEVIEEKKLIGNEPELEVMVASLQIWKFTQRHADSKDNKMKKQEGLS